MCVIYGRPVIIVPISAHSFHHFHPKSSGARGYLLVRWNVALMRRGLTTCVADCTHFHLISF